MPRTKEELQKHMGSSMVSGKTLKGLDLAKQTSWKSLGCAPSRRETWDMDLRIHDRRHREH